MGSPFPSHSHEHWWSLPPGGVGWDPAPSFMERRSPQEVLYLRNSVALGLGANIVMPKLLC